MVTTVSTEGQIQIPAEIREQLGITPGAKIAISVEGARIVLQPLDKLRAIDELCGITAGGPSMADELTAERREEDHRWTERWS